MTLSPDILQRLNNHPDIERVFSDPEDCYSYGYDNSRRHALPECVVFPKNTTGVQAVLQLAAQHQIAVTARGRATGTPGGSVPLSGGIVLCTLEMNQVLAFSPADRYITVQTGILNETVQQQVSGTNLFWPPDPTSKAYCTIGGNLAYNSAGPMAVKYGSTRDHVLGLVAVTGTGQILKTGVKTTKGVVGYDLTRLLIGSEGTLGIITEATLKLTPKPRYQKTLRLLYPSIQSATAAVCQIMTQAAIPCMLEFMDNHALALIRQYSGLTINPNATALLLIEVDGNDAQELTYKIDEICRAAQTEICLEMLIAEDPMQSKQLWAARKALSPCLRHIAPDKINEDIVVPISQVPRLLEELGKLSQNTHIPIVCFGHIGNGNLHVNILYDARTQTKTAKEILATLFHLVLTLGGTLSGEHGVGIDKLPYLGQELSTEVLTMMQGIKQLFDPRGILNPFKIGGPLIPPTI